MTFICLRCLEVLEGAYCLLEHGANQMFWGEIPHFPFRKMSIGSWEERMN